MVDIIIKTSEQGTAVLREALQTGIKSERSELTCSMRFDLNNMNDSKFTVKDLEGLASKYTGLFQELDFLEDQVMNAFEEADLPAHAAVFNMGKRG